jgi:hypothetical protein
LFSSVWRVRSTILTFSGLDSRIRSGVLTYTATHSAASAAAVATGPETQGRTRDFG